MSDMERRRAPLATLEISSLEDDAETPLTRELATAASKASSGGMRLLQKPQQAAALELFSTARRSGGRVFLGLSSVWILLGLCWIRWPLYYRELVPALERRLGDKMEVEPVVVSCALVAPFLVAGGVFYWKQDAIGTLEGWGHNLRALRWLKAHPNIGKRLGFDAVDVLLVSGFLLLQVNLVVGKLLIDRESGKLAKAGLLSRTARAFGMNGLYALVLSLLLVARRSFLHKLFGLSGERAARYHVLTGQFGAVMLVLHGVLYVLVWYMQGKVSEMLVPCLEETCTPKQQYGSSRNFFGLVAMVPLIVIVLSSLEWSIDARVGNAAYGCISHMLDVALISTVTTTMTTKLNQMIHRMMPLHEFSDSTRPHYSVMLLSGIMTC
ncbi:ferric/cupric-chelate reductase [Phytophthora boehmeriae]|uniref:Ferric/cupric-chelate reductase n=1 Tax=Phytophthora boehmeriae TaxID=109152 RepID=A0A8T1WRR0_9STRA|nr:ferric/cupric-chelate reductase [Phytophthora boehmeriae]